MPVGLYENIKCTQTVCRMSCFKPCALCLNILENIRSRALIVLVLRVSRGIILIVLAITGMNEEPIDSPCRFAQVTCSGKNMELCIYWFRRTSEMPSPVFCHGHCRAFTFFIFTFRWKLLQNQRINKTMFWLPGMKRLVPYYTHSHVNSVDCEESAASGSGSVQAQSATYTGGSKITLDLKVFLPHGPSKKFVNQFFYCLSRLSILMVYINSRAIYVRKCNGVLCPFITLPLAETLSKHLSKMSYLWNESVLLVRDIDSDGRNGMCSLICYF